MLSVSCVTTASSRTLLVPSLLCCCCCYLWLLAPVKNIVIVFVFPRRLSRSLYNGQQRLSSGAICRTPELPYRRRLTVSGRGKGSVKIQPQGDNFVDKHCRSGELLSYKCESSHRYASDSSFRADISKKGASPMSGRLPFGRSA